MRRATVASLLFAAVVAAACGAGSPSGDTAGTPSGAPADTAAPSSGAPSSAVPPASSEPVDSPSPSGAASTDQPSAASPSAGTDASASASPGIADVCQPAGSNPSFWPGIAAAVTWDVYCAVLPKGWFVASGSYRLANGGRLVMSYKGPGGTSLTLSEGSFCTDGSGCVPSGSETGPAAFGSLSGTLVTVDGGGYAIVVDRGQTPSWLMVTSGLDQATTVSLGAALARVGG